MIVRNFDFKRLFRGCRNSVAYWRERYDIERGELLLLERSIRKMCAAAGVECIEDLEQWIFSRAESGSKAVDTRLAQASGAIGRQFHSANTKDQDEN